MTTRRSISWAIDHDERNAREQLRRERALNTVIEARRKGITPTAAYHPALPSWMPCFSTPAAYIRYLARREMGKYDPTVVVNDES
jgi:hypothetical protein